LRDRTGSSKVLTSTCPGLVQRVEAGCLDGPETRAILEEALHPMLAAGADTIVLGCTHYPFVIPLIQSIVGPDVNVIDPSPAVARQVDRILKEKSAVRPGERGTSFDADSPAPTGHTELCTTGDPGKFSDLSAALLYSASEDRQLPGELIPISPLVWNGVRLCQL